MRKQPDDLVRLIEGLALRKPRLSCAAINRRAIAAAKTNDWQAPSYSTTHAIIRALDPAMVTLAQDGATAYRDRYELVYAALAKSRTAFYTPTVSEPARQTRDDLGTLTTRVEGCIELAQHPERIFPDTRHRDLIQLLIIDEAERLSAQGLEHVRDIFDRTGISVILIGMPGLSNWLLKVSVAVSWLRTSGFQSARFIEYSDRIGKAQISDR